MGTSLKYTCPKCHRPIVKEVEQDSGIIDIVCPHPDCGFTFKGRVKKPVMDNSGKDPLPSDKVLKVGEEADITCPHCKLLTHVESVEKACKKTVGCQHCMGPIEVRVIEPTRELELEANPYRGKIQITLNRFRKKDYPLRPGVNIIGRADKEAPSDIQLNDETVSRRSVEIEVKVGERGGFFFHFRVRKATNPVLVNSRRINPGEEILLEYGAIITMGRTKLRFDKID